MATFRYLVTELLTGDIVAELPLGDVRLQSLLNGAGSASGTLKLSDTRALKAFDEIGTQPGRAGLVALINDSAAIWGGILWTRPYQVEAEVISWTAQEWWSALSRRKITSDHAWDGASVETAVGDLLADAQAGLGGDIGYTHIGTTGQIITSSTLAVNRPWASEAIRAVLNGSGTSGVDFANTTAYTGGRGLPVLKLGSPLLGRDGVTNGLTIAEPISGVWSEDATQWATTVYATSRGAGSAAITAEVSNAVALAGGYPRWDLEIVVDSDASTEAVTAAAQACLDARAPGGAFGPLTCRAIDPDVTQIQLGDTILATFSPNVRFPNGLIADVRVTGWTLVPGEDGGIDQLTMEVAQP